MILLAPVMSRLDHVRPALHRLSIIDGKDVDVINSITGTHNTQTRDIL